MVGRQDLIAQGEDGDAGFQAAGAAEQMAGHGFGGADRDLALAKKVADGVGLQRVADGRGRSVGVDVIDFVRS